MGRRVLRRVLRRGSKKGLSRRHLEGRNTPFREYDPLGVRPTVGREIGRKFCFEDSGSFYLCPPGLSFHQNSVPEASFSQAHSPLSHWMLCCSVKAKKM